MNACTLARTRGVIEEGREASLHLGAQVAVFRAGELCADVSFGEESPGIPMRPDHLLLWMSAGKPFTALAVGMLVQGGCLAFDSPVVEWIPAFGEGGKDGISVKDLLCHTGGFRGADLRIDRQPWAEIIALICATPREPGWQPGVKAGYHAASAWYILAELVRLIDGRPIEDFVRDEICRPFDLEDTWMALAPDRQAEYGDRVARVYPGEEGQLTPHTVCNEPEERGRVSPGRSMRGPARDLARFYAGLLHPGDVPGSPVHPDLVQQLTARVRVGMPDATFRHVMDWGMGFIPDNNRYGADTVPYGYGGACSPRTFGHGGAQSSTGFADPAHDLSVAILFNGMPGEALHQARLRRTCEAVYQDLGLA